MRLSAYRDLLVRKNTFDFGLLEPGDIVLCANPRDVFLLRTLLFWSHAGIYTGDEGAHAFVDAVNLPVRGRRRGGRLTWQRVRYSSLAMYQSYVDVVVLRVDCPPEKRLAAADFAQTQLGKPFPRNLWVSFLSRRSDAQAYSCTSLVWHAYKIQGLDLSPLWLFRLVLPWPSALAANPRVRIIGVGTRLKNVPWRSPYLMLAFERFWFKAILRKRIAPPAGPAEPPPRC